MQHGHVLVKPCQSMQSKIYWQSSTSAVVQCFAGNGGNGGGKGGGGGGGTVASSSSTYPGGIGEVARGLSGGVGF